MVMSTHIPVFGHITLDGIGEGHSLCQLLSDKDIAYNYLFMVQKKGFLDEEVDELQYFMDLP